MSPLTATEHHRSGEIRRSHEKILPTRLEFGKPYLVALNKLHERDSQRLADLAQLREIEHLLAVLVPAHVRCRALYLDSKVLLENPFPLTQLLQKSLENLLLGAVDTFSHPDRVDVLRQIAFYRT